MVAFIGVLSAFGVIVCLVWAIVSKVRGKNAKPPLLWAVACFTLVILLSTFDVKLPEMETQAIDNGEAPSETAVEVEEANSISEHESTPEPEILEVPILLIAGEKGEYGEWFTIGEGTEFEESFFIYRVPSGVYTVTNSGVYPAQVSVYQGIYRNTETGFDEYSDIGSVIRLEVGESGKITVPEGWFIEIHEPDKVSLVRSHDAP